MRKVLKMSFPPATGSKADVVVVKSRLPICYVGGFGEDMGPFETGWNPPRGVLQVCHNPILPKALVATSDFRSSTFGVEAVH